jgi:hypothetical protein
MSERKAYPSDLSDAEWQQVEALAPGPLPGGRPAKYVEAALRGKVRRAAGKKPAPTAAIIDSQAVKTSDAGGQEALMCPKANHWPQATYPGRHPGPDLAGQRHGGQRAGPRRRAFALLPNLASADWGECA